MRSLPAPGKGRVLRCPEHGAWICGSASPIRAGLSARPGPRQPGGYSSPRRPAPEGRREPTAGASGYSKTTAKTQSLIPHEMECMRQFRNAIVTLHVLIYKYFRQHIASQGPATAEVEKAASAGSCVRYEDHGQEEDARESLYRERRELSESPRPEIVL